MSLIRGGQEMDGGLSVPYPTVSTVPLSHLSACHRASRLTILPGRACVCVSKRQRDREEKEAGQALQNAKIHPSVWVCRVLRPTQSSCPLALRGETPSSQPATRQNPVLSCLAMPKREGSWREAK